MSYNGWTNWATWNVALWIDNEEPLYREKMRFLRRQWRELDAADVEQFCRDLFPDGTPDMDGKTELRDVDWGEIASNWQDEVEQEEA